MKTGTSHYFKKQFMRKTRGTNTGFNGVTKRGETRFEAWARFPGDRGKRHVGTFKTLPEAVDARTKFITSII